MNVAIICASLLVMKPLLAKWIPAMISEQPLSASEDKKFLRRLTGLALLDGGLVDEEKSCKQGRRDTGVEMGSGRRDIESNGLSTRAISTRSPDPSSSTNTSSLQ